MQFIEDTLDLLNVLDRHFDKIVSLLNEKEKQQFGNDWTILVENLKSAEDKNQQIQFLNAIIEEIEKYPIIWNRIFPSRNPHTIRCSIEDIMLSQNNTQIDKYPQIVDKVIVVGEAFEKLDISKSSAQSSLNSSDK